LHSSERQAAIDLRIKQVNALNARREKQQGLGRPIIAAKLRDHQMVAVGNRVHFSTKWRTFHDFLRDHLFSLLGKEWGEAELAKPPEERHRILRWFDQAGNHGLHHAPPRGDSGVHRLHRDRRRRLSLVRGSRQQRLRLLQIARVKPFSEPSVNRSK
jgi:hypothetical protein